MHAFARIAGAAFLAACACALPPLAQACAFRADAEVHRVEYDNGDVRYFHRMAGFGHKVTVLQKQMPVSEIVMLDTIIVSMQPLGSPDAIPTVYQLDGISDYLLSEDRYSGQRAFKAVRVHADSLDLVEIRLDFGQPFRMSIGDCEFEAVAYTLDQGGSVISTYVRLSGGLSVMTGGYLREDPAQAATVQPVRIASE